jgi:prepilin-type N-terminal cleavage/methylation domain-containing protein
MHTGLGNCNFRAAGPATALPAVGSQVRTWNLDGTAHIAGAAPAPAPGRGPAGDAGAAPARRLPAAPAAYASPRGVGPRPWERFRRPCRRGLGLAELMIALVISALLLTAAAAALDASFKAYAINQEHSSLLQQARVTLHRISTAIRTSDTHAPLSNGPLASFAAGTTVTDTGIQMYDASDNLIAYQFDQPNQRLLCVVGGTSHVMLEGVTAFSVNLEPMRSPAAVRAAGAYDLLRRAIITLSVRTTGSTAQVGESTGTQTLTLSAAVAPRRNAW